MFALTSRPAPPTLSEDDAGGDAATSWTAEEKIKTNIAIPCQIKEPPPFWAKASDGWTAILDRGRETCRNVGI